MVPLGASVIAKAGLPFPILARRSLETLDSIVQISAGENRSTGFGRKAVDRDDGLSDSNASQPDALARSFPRFPGLCA